jgi:hypothetical protein
MGSVVEEASPQIFTCGKKGWRAVQALDQEVGFAQCLFSLQMAHLALQNYLDLLHPYSSLGAQ